MFNAAYFLERNIYSESPPLYKNCRLQPFKARKIVNVSVKCLKDY